jgi:ribosomal protein S18 acetylase RimI-like enzyme
LLEDMVVGPEICRQGVGTQLLSAVIDHARQQGCLRITLLTDVDNQVAQAFYQRQGFVGSSMIPLRLMLK